MILKNNNNTCDGRHEGKVQDVLRVRGWDGFLEEVTLAQITFWLMGIN